MLLQNGYKYMPYVFHEKYIEDNKTDYYLALRQSQKTFISKLEVLLKLKKIERIGFDRGARYKKF